MLLMQIIFAEGRSVLKPSLIHEPFETGSYVSQNPWDSVRDESRSANHPSKEMHLEFTGKSNKAMFYAEKKSVTF